MNIFYKKTLMLLLAVLVVATVVSRDVALADSGGDFGSQPFAVYHINSFSGKFNRNAGVQYKDGMDGSYITTSSFSYDLSDESWLDFGAKNDIKDLALSGRKVQMSSVTQNYNPCNYTVKYVWNGSTLTVSKNKNPDDKACPQMEDSVSTFTEKDADFPDVFLLARKAHAFGAVSYNDGLDMAQSSQALDFYLPKKDTPYTLIFSYSSAPVYRISDIGSPQVNPQNSGRTESKKIVVRSENRLAKFNISPSSPYWFNNPVTSAPIALVDGVMEAISAPVVSSVGSVSTVPGKNNFSAELLPNSKVQIRGKGFSPDSSNWVVIRPATRSLYDYRFSDLQISSLDSDGTSITFKLPPELYPGSYILQVGTNDSDWSQPIKLTVTDPHVPPATIHISSNPQVVDYNKQSPNGPIITWSTQNAVSCTASTNAAVPIDGFFGPVEPFGRVFTEPIENTTVYTLTCQGYGGSATGTEIVKVINKPIPRTPPEISLISTPLGDGGQFKVSWNTSRADSCTTNYSGPDTAPSVWNNGGLNGHFVFVPTGFTSLSINCTNTAGMNSKTLSVTPITRSSPAGGGGGGSIAPAAQDITPAPIFVPPAPSAPEASSNRFGSYLGNVLQAFERLKVLLKH